MVLLSRSRELLKINQGQRHKEAESQMIGQTVEADGKYALWQPYVKDISVLLPIGAHYPTWWILDNFSGAMDYN